MHEITLATVCSDARNRHNCHSEKVLILAEMVSTRDAEIARMKALALDEHEQIHKLEAQFAQLHHLITSSVEGNPVAPGKCECKPFGFDLTRKVVNGICQRCGKPARKEE